MQGTNPQIDENKLENLFSKFDKNNKNTQDKVQHTQTHVMKKNVIQSQSQDEDQKQFMKAMNQKIQAIQKTDVKLNSSKKRLPESIQTHAPQLKQPKLAFQSLPPKIKQLTYQQLPQQIVFYLIDVYQFQDNKLFISGIMQNGQAFNIVSNQTQRQLYFAFKKQDFQDETLSQQFIEKGVKQINQRLKQIKVNDFYSELSQKQYVFELDGICRSKRPYFKVRYPFKNPQIPSPDWEGDYFKYVFGTTYTPLELFILNTNIKGPCWVKIQKQHLKQNKRNIQGGLCADIDIAEHITPTKQITKPPTLRVMSISLKAIIPSQLSKKSLFPTNRIDQSHIYCISYTYCDEYMVELKPPKYNSYQKTFYLKDFGKMNEINFVQCDNEKQMIAQFLADVYYYDPDVLVCHDSAKILDALIQRMMQINDKNDKPRIGRLVNFQNISSTNQHSRISSTIAGRLLVDTFLHSKDMIKSIDYELESMSKYIKPEKNFKGMTQEQVKNFLQSGKTFFVLKKVRDQAQVTLALMNHLQVLQLSRNLSVICGNLWKRSLQNQRAQRNEYLIMHECIRRDLIIPDKFKTYKNDDENEEVDKKKYAGGMVIEPKKGMYHDFIILLDFNSLYPSIIREYNICFSKLDRPKMPLSKYYKAKKKNTNGNEKNVKTQKMQEEKPSKNYDDDVEISPSPKELCSKDNWGFLPHLIDGIVSQRKKCKKLMKNATPQKCIILDIQQKSYKIVANSIYGCLGFSISRFYSKPMAALITRMGRQALQRANDIVNARGGVQVIYGDTDSLMIQPTGLNKQTDRQKIMEIKQIADDLKKSINKEYQNLEIDIDGIFKPIILLMKKKYVANKLINFEKIIAGIDNEPQFNLEFKGIEVVRRDGCEVARSSLKRILEILMNSKKTDPFEVYQEIYEQAKKLNNNLSQMSTKDFLFSKQLNKKIKEYVNAETMPHVKVAMDRIKNGEKQQTLVNHTIYYLVTKPKLESQDSLAKCCIDDRTFQKSQRFDNAQKYEIDYEYYKQEILQPWMRIFIHLQEFNLDKLFESFDVKDADRKKIKKTLKNDKEQIDNGLQDFLTNDMKQKSHKFNEQIGQVICGNCKNTIFFSQNGQIVTKCKYCPIDNSKQLVNMLSNKISYLLKQKLSKYYSNNFKCECQKTYALSLISRCCRVHLQKKTIIPFQVHTFVYLTKELIEMTILRQKLSEDVEKRLYRINQNILNKFLEESDFENLQGLFSGFRL